MFGKNRKQTGKQAAISTHPAFPAVVALWFAALLGLGSLVLPVMLFEKLATATGLSSVVSAAAPPLGMTARLLIAGVAAVAGAIAGVFIARKVAAAQGNTTSERAISPANRGEQKNDPGQKRPISAHEELGSEYLDEPIAGATQTPGRYTGRRRALAVTDDSGPSEYLESAPLPGENLTIDPAPQTPREDEPSADESDTTDTLDLDELGLTEEASLPDQHSEELVEQAPIAMPVPEPEWAAEDNDRTSFTASETIPVNASAGSASYDETTPLTPREELAAMTQRLTTPAEATAYNPLSQHAANNEIGQDDHSMDSPVHAEPTTVEASGQPVLDQSLSDLGMVELVERFALALQNKKMEDAKAQQPKAAPYNPFEQNITDETEIEPPVFRRSNPEETAPAAPAAEPQHIQPLPSFAQSAPNALPSSLQPMTLDEELEEDAFDGIEDLGLSLNVSPNRFAKPEPVENAADTASDIGADTGADGDSEFSSLLSLKSPLNAGQEFVRIDAEFDRPNTAEPVVVFPGQHAGSAHDALGSVPLAEPQQAEPAPKPRAFDAPQGIAPQASTAANNSETERALRDALEKLQKMSGAA